MKVNNDPEGDERVQRKKIEDQSDIGSNFGSQRSSQFEQMSLSDDEMSEGGGEIAEPEIQQPA